MLPSHRPPTATRPRGRIWGRAAIAPVIWAALATASCSPSTPTPSAAAPSGTASAGASSSAAPTTPATSGGNASPVGSFDPSKIAVELDPVAEIAGSPLSIAAPDDGSGRLFVADKGGPIWIVVDGKVGEQPLLDISSKVSTGGEQGLLGLALYPDFPADPRLVIDYTDVDGDTVVSEWRLSSADPNRVDPASERIVLTVDQPFANHNGGAVVFGPDGKLYVSLGDGGSGGDPQGNGQRLDTLLAKILRIDPDGGDGGTKGYGIPDDNPFVGQGGARPEIWLTGLRNPWRISFDRSTDDLWIGDVGQNRFEEIDVVRAGSGGGLNFGWNTMEGFHCFPSGDPCAPPDLVPPVTEYSHEFGCSVTGGVVYRGSQVPELSGAYLFADYCSGTMWAIDATAGEVREPVIVAETGRSISSFGEDAAGEVYATDLGGQVLRVTAHGR